jgi:hypothetical protein
VCRVLTIAVTAFVALGLVGVGAGALLAPGVSSRQYGIALDDARALAFIRAMGVRDVVMGALLLLLAAAGQRELLAWGLLASAAVAGVDFALVSAAGAQPRARALHALGGIALLTAALIVATRG